MGKHELAVLTPGLLKPDGINLTLIGNAVFLNTLEEAADTFFTKPITRVYDAIL